MKLVGRDAALVVGGAPTLLRFSGEPGIGKTRLLTELDSRANQCGILVLAGRASEFERDVPFAVFVAALGDYLAGLPHLPSAPTGVLSAVFPGMIGDGIELSELFPVERYRLHRAVGALLKALSETRPLVVVLDDLHWFDDASAELLIHLLVAPVMPRVLLATSDRPAQVGAPLAAALARGEIEQRVLTVEVGPLNHDDALRLIGDRHDPRDAAAIYRESGSNPFYLQELARAGAMGQADAWRETTPGVPRRVLAAIALEIDALPEVARHLAMGAAVAGEPFDVDAARAAAGTCVEDDTLDLIDVLVEAGLVQPTAAPRHLQFRHPIVRRAVYESAGQGWRIGAHRRLTAALRERDASPVELSHHLAAAAEPGDPGAVDVLVAAGRLLRVRAPALAAERFGDAIRLLDAPGRDSLRAQLHELRSGALAATGRLDESHDALVNALAATPDGTSDEQVRPTAAIARIEHVLGLTDQANRRLRSALGALADRRSRHAAALEVELAIATGYLLGDWPEGAAHANEALAIARACGDRGVEATALVLLTLGEYHAGRFEAAAAAHAAASRTVDALTDDDLAAGLSAVYYLAITEFYLDRPRDAVRHADRGITLSRSTGEGHFLLSLLGARTSALVHLGRLREARLTSDETLDAARVSGNDQVLLLALIDRTFLDVARGDLDLALVCGEEALDLATRLPPTFLTTVAGWAMAQALIEQGEPDRAVQLLLNPQGRAAIEAATPPGPCLAWHLVAIAQAMRGELEDAAQWVRRIDAALPKLHGLLMPSVWAEVARSHLMLAAGDAQRAADAALAAANNADDGGIPYEATRARLLAARSLAAAGNRDDAVRLLERCRLEFDQYGAARQHDEAVQELRRLGRRVGRGGRRGEGGAGIQALSEREAEIAEFVAAGMTNRDIGDSLFISTRTVERHLTHVFEKLGIDSRSQLGRALERARG